MSPEISGNSLGDHWWWQAQFGTQQLSGGDEDIQHTRVLSFPIPRSSLLWCECVTKIWLVMQALHQCPCLLAINRTGHSNHELLCWVFAGYQRLLYYADRCCSVCFLLVFFTSFQFNNQWLRFMAVALNTMPSASYMWLANKLMASMLSASCSQKMNNTGEGLDWSSTQCRHLKAR